MANKEHLDLLKQGGKVWNNWRETSSIKKPDLSSAQLSKMDLKNFDLSWVALMDANLQGSNLQWANLRRANLRKADLRRTILREANLSWANLSWVNLRESYLRRANFRKADLSWANLKECNLREADLREADLRNADLRATNLRGANLKGANLREAYLSDAELIEADLEQADLREADLRGAHLLKANLKHANLAGCHVYGISSWDARVDETTNQDNLVVTDWDEPTVSVDTFPVAQFIYLLLHHPILPRIFKAATTEIVLILGRFGPERRTILDTLRTSLRQHQYLPLLLDFAKPDSEQFTEMISILAHMACFVIADFTSSPTILPAAAHIIRAHTLPFQPILHLHAQPEPPMLTSLHNHHDTVLETVCYADSQELAAIFQLQILTPLKRKAQELRHHKIPVA